MEPYEVWGSGDEIRDFFHITDMVRGCLLALEKHATCDAINLGYGKGFAIQDVVRIILKENWHTKTPKSFQHVQTDDNTF